MNRQFHRKLSKGWASIVRFFRQGLFSLSILAMVLGLITLLLVLEPGLDNPLATPSQFFKALKDSAILGVVESVSIITGVILLLASGHKEQRKKERYDALAMLEASNGLERSILVRDVVEKLHREGEAFRDFSFSEKLNLTNTKLCNADFWRAKLPKVQFNDAKLTNACFLAAQMEEAQFQGAMLLRADFRGAVLHQANFKAAILKNASFRTANLEKSEFHSSSLEGVDFHGANLKDCEFDDAHIQSADFRGVIDLPRDSIVKADGWGQALFDAGVISDLRTRAARATARNTSVP